MLEREVLIPAGEAALPGTLTLPDDPVGLVVFAHGSGSGRHSPRNRYVAGVLQQRGLATLLFDLLTESEEDAERLTRHLRFDIGLLARRLAAAIDWSRARADASRLPVGLFGSSTGGGAALVASVLRPHAVHAVVSRGGRPDLAGDVLPHVTAPTLLLVGSRDADVVALNREAMARMPGEATLRLVEGATHLFEEPGALEEVAGVAAEWLAAKLGGGGRARTEDAPDIPWTG